MKLIQIILLMLIPSTGFSYVENMSPDSALQKLQEGNRRFTDDRIIHPNRCRVRRQASAKRQLPYAIVLSCADSRVCPEILFDQGIGDIFVIRVAGTALGQLELESIKYSLFNNNSKLILVLGHESCGAFKALCSNQTAGIGGLSQVLTAPKEDCSVEDAIRNHVKAVCNELKKDSDIQPLLDEGEVKVVGGYYHLEDGHVEFIK